MILNDLMTDATISKAIDKKFRTIDNPIIYDGNYGYIYIYIYIYIYSFRWLSLTSAGRKGPSSFIVLK